MAEIHTYPEMNAQIKDLLRIGEQPICLYAAKRIEELEEYERKKGKWIHFSRSDECSVCGYDTGKYEAPTWFCPKCGADMR